VNEGGGARTPLSGAVAAGIVLIVVLFLSHLLSALPQPVLAAVVLVAVAGLVKVSTLKALWRSDRREFVVAMAAIVGVLGSGLLRGVMIGRDHLAAPGSPSRVDPARRRPRAHSRDAAVLGSGAAS
jgi:MFS superfamily sulfate permease-like transporter